MKKLILITTLFLAFACSKDDESGETFLDKYNSTSWTVEGSEEILTFSNGTYFYSQYFAGDTFIEGNEEDIFECMQYKEGTNVIFGIELTYEILKNEADELLFEATLMGQKLGTMKFTPQGENLLMTEISIDEGEETTTLISSDSSYDDYCN